MGNELLTKVNLGRDFHLIPTTLVSPKGIKMTSQIIVDDEGYEEEPEDEPESGRAPQEIIFEENRREYVLNALDRGIDDDGYIIDPNGDRVLATDGEPIKPEDIGYIGHGSTDFVRDDISQIREYLHKSP